MKKFEIKKQEIDLMNVFLCLLVIFIHIASEAVSSLRNDSWQFFLVYIPHKLSSLAVYGFIFISAVKLFLKDVDKINTLTFYKKRAKKIIIPYLVSVLIFYIYFIHLGYFKFSLKDYIRICFKGRFSSTFLFCNNNNSILFFISSFKKSSKEDKTFFRNFSFICNNLLFYKIFTYMAKYDF